MNDGLEPLTHRDSATTPGDLGRELQALALQTTRQAYLEAFILAVTRAPGLPEHQNPLAPELAKIVATGLLANPELTERIQLMSGSHDIHSERKIEALGELVAGVGLGECGRARHRLGKFVLLISNGGQNGFEGLRDDIISMGGSQEEFDKALEMRLPNG